MMINSISGNGINIYIAKEETLDEYIVYVEFSEENTVTLTVDEFVSLSNMSNVMLNENDLWKYTSEEIESNRRINQMIQGPLIMPL